MRIAHDGIEWALRCDHVIEVGEGVLRPIRVGRAGILAAGRVANPKVLAGSCMRVCSLRPNPRVARAERRDDGSHLPLKCGRIVGAAVEGEEAECVGARREGEELQRN